MTLRRWFWGALFFILAAVIVLESVQLVKPMMTFTEPPVRPVLLPATVTEQTPSITGLSIAAVLDAHGTMAVTYRVVVNTEGIAEPLLTVDLPKAHPADGDKKQATVTIHSAEVAVDAESSVPAAHFELPDAVRGYVFERYLIRPLGKRANTVVTFRYIVDNPVVSDGKNAELTWYFDIFARAQGSPAAMTITFAQPPLDAACRTVNLWNKPLIEPCHGQTPELQQSTIMLPTGWSMNESVLTFTLPQSDMTRLASLQSLPSRTPTYLIAGSLAGWLLLAGGSACVLRRRRKQIQQRPVVLQQVCGLCLGLAICWGAYRLAAGPIQRCYGLGSAVGWGLLVIPSLLIATTIVVFVRPCSWRTSHTQ